MKKGYVWLLLFLFLLGMAYLLGPCPASATLDTAFPEIRSDIDNIAGYVEGREAGLPVKPGNGAEIVWADSAGVPTEHVLLYLHGFSASHYEGSGVTYDFVREFGVNAYLPRLASHGLDVPEPLLDMTPARLYDSAKEALAVAHKLGRKVVVMGTSTGCTLALMLAADFPELVDGLILYSPNIKIRNPFAPLLSGHWGLQLSRLVHGGRYAVSGDDPAGDECRYWNCRYRVEAQVYLQQLLDLRMNRREFARVHQPVFLGYYYKDRKHQDGTVSVRAALRMFDALGTPDALKEKRAFPEAGAHVIACKLTSGAVPAVREATFEFAERVLGLTPRSRSAEGSAVVW